jgi:hypothetical protein
VPDEDVRVVDLRKEAQDLRQIRRADLAGSTGPVGERGELEDRVGIDSRMCHGQKATIGDVIMPLPIVNMTYSVELYE